jgi:hypothetical protein
MAGTRHVLEQMPKHLDDRPKMGMANHLPL